jgi:hypothetical protein
MANSAIKEFEETGKMGRLEQIVKLGRILKAEPGKVMGSLKAQKTRKSNLCGMAISGAGDKERARREADSSGSIEKKHI